MLDRKLLLEAMLTATSATVSFLLDQGLLFRVHPPRNLSWTGSKRSGEHSQDAGAKCSSTKELAGYQFSLLSSLQGQVDAALDWVAD